MRKPSTWLAIIAAVVYCGAYWYSKQNIDSVYHDCLKGDGTRAALCDCQREAMMDAVSLYRVITAYEQEMTRVRQAGEAACARR